MTKSIAPWRQKRGRPLNETKKFFEQPANSVLEWISNAWWYILVICQMSVIAFFEIILVLCNSRAKTTRTKINETNEIISDEATRVAREQGLGEMIEDVMGTRMMRIKTHFLVALEKRDKLQTIIDNNPSGEAEVADSHSIASEPTLRRESSRFGRFFGSVTGSGRYTVT
eukprot:CAMPEP_0116863990 /NCGR_PEP_ID=MMETSP0418-20121206/24561_1 /TAXON_ID=1158023 /ORGANISM="Astrosyne radiata, Strain 13vi08-1A" /LENGTH=169 /DNA_ID=CAMNT_0004499137 /DNA_START=76 /DNA_END=585 /DNA_ORIENTATION=-